MISIVESKKTKCVGQSGLQVSFPYDPKIVAAIKSIEGATWKDKQKIWEVPSSMLSKLIDELTYLDDIKFVPLDSNESKEELHINPQTFKTKMLPHQIEGVEWMINNPNGLLLDCPGLGKSIQTIYAAETLYELGLIKHCLIICGINTLKQNWKKEVEKHSRYSCRIIGEKISSRGKISYASVAERAAELGSKLDPLIIIINIESMRDKRVVEAIKDSATDYDMIVVDECHKIGNPQAQQTQGLLALSGVGKYHYGLTGTLLTNSPFNAYTPLKFINKENSTYSAFKNFYGEYAKKFGHLELMNYKNTDILKEQLELYSLRRDKSTLKNLPSKMIVQEYIDLDENHKKFYDDLEAGIIDDIDLVTIKNTTMLGLITRLRQAIVCPQLLSSNEFVNTKNERAKDLVDEIIESGEKVVIFSTFKEPLYRMQELLKDYNPLLGTGDLDDAEVSKNIDLFQSDPKYKVFLATTSKCGTGITLTAASYEIFLDSSWVPSIEEQCEDRCHRIGQDKSVTVYKLIANNTIDERVQKILERKQGIADYIIDNKDVSDRDEICELLGISMLK